MPIFGSDGFRCKFGTSFLTKESIVNFSKSLASYYADEGFNKPIVIARDTRKSGEVIQDIIIEILINSGINVCLADILPTPGLSKIIQNGNFAFGCMITASHNPHDDNGIKLLRGDGFKINLRDQEKIESYMLKPQKELKKNISNIGKIINLDSCFVEYLDDLIENINPEHSEYKIIVDCANGSNSYKLNRLSKINNMAFVSNKPNGHNINLNCGALETTNLLVNLERSNADFGVAFDGDGDRAVFVSKKYGLIETEKIALLFFKIFKDRYASKKVVTTEISNLSFKHNLEELGGELIETPVGDRFVIDLVLKYDALFGFEPSGHFYFPKISNSMDGMASLLIFLKLLNSIHGLDDELYKISQYSRIQKNYDISEQINIDEKIIKKTIMKLIDLTKEKIVIRKSMWDPVLRLYYDFIEEDNFPIIENHLLETIDKLEIDEI